MSKITNFSSDFETLIDNVITDTQSTTSVSQVVDLRPSEQLSILLGSRYYGEVLSIENRETIIRACFAYIYPLINSGVEFLSNRLVDFVNTYIKNDERNKTFTMIKAKYTDPITKSLDPTKSALEVKTQEIFDAIPVADFLTPVTFTTFYDIVKSVL
jgi:hypothetical protein